MAGTSQHVEDGNDLAAIDAALQAARDETTRPSLIAGAHAPGLRLAASRTASRRTARRWAPTNVRKTKQNLGWPVEPDFLVPDDALAHMREAVERGTSARRHGTTRFAAYAQANQTLAGELERSLHGELPRRLGRGHSGLSRRCEGHGHARGLRQGDERHRAEACRR